MKRSTKLTILLVIFIDALGVSIVYPSLSPLFIEPQYTLFATSLSIDARQILLGLTFASYPLCMFIGSLILGAYSDKVGRKNALLISMIGIAIGYFIVAYGVFAQGFLIILLGRIVSGLTAGCHTLAQAVIADTSPTADKAGNMSHMVFASSMGFVIGPLLGGMFNGNFVLPFVITGFLAIACFIFLLTSFEESHEGDEESSLGIKNILASYKVLLKRPQISALALVFLLFLIAWNFYFQFVSVYIIQTYNYTPAQLGYFMAYAGACLVITFGLIAKPALKYFQLYRGLKYGLALGAIGFLLMISVQLEWMLWLSTLPLAIGISIAYSVVITLFSDLANKKEQGKVMAISTCTKSLAWTVAPLVAGLLASLHLILPFVVGALAVITALILFAVKFRQHD